MWKTDRGEIKLIKDLNQFWEIEKDSAVFNQEDRLQHRKDTGPILRRLKTTVRGDPLMGWDEKRQGEQREVANCAELGKKKERNGCSIQKYIAIKTYYPL